MGLFRDEQPREPAAFPFALLLSSLFPISAGTKGEDTMSQDKPSFRRDDPRSVGNFERGARDAHVHQDRLDDDDITAMGGASDASSGGGAGAGVPDGDTGMLTEGAINKGNVEEDRRKLFPKAKTKRQPE
jgi:hypothetical protein